MPDGRGILAGVSAVLLASTAIAQAPASAPTKFDLVRQQAREYFVQGNSALEQQIESVYLPVIVGIPSNTLHIDDTADVSIRLTNGKVERLQLFEKAGTWTVSRNLGADKLHQAHPQVVDEYRDAYHRETERLKQRMSLELEDWLRRESKLDLVKNAYPRCFVELDFGKALCDISYSTWSTDYVGCFRSVLFRRVDGNWEEVPGAYHPGMRIHPDNGELFEMEPREPCARK